MLIEFFWIWDLYSTPPALAIDAMTTCASSKQTGGPVDALLLDCFVHSELSCHVHNYGNQLLLNCCCGFSLASCRYVIYMYDISRPSEMLIASWADKCSRNASTSGEVGAGRSSCLWIIWWGYVYKFLCPCISGIWKEHRTKPCCQPQGIAWCKLLFYAKFSGSHGSLWMTEFSMLSYVHWVGMCNFPAWQTWRFFIVQLVEGAFPALSYINLFLGPDWVVQNCTLLVWSVHCLPVLQIVILGWTGNNVTRPLRVAGAAVLAPFIDKFLKKTQKVLNLPNQAFAFMIVVASFASLCLSVVGVLILSRWGK